MTPNLTHQQYLDIRAHINASIDPSVVQARTDGNIAELARLYNLTSSPDFWVWRTRVTKDEYTQSTSIDGTTFNWTGAGFITRSQGERDAWRELFNGAGVGGNAVNPSLPSVRQAFTDIFSGATAPAPANRTHMSTISRRRCSIVERLFVSGTGSTASPGLLGTEGPITDVEMQRVMFDEPA
jgi:hypothetical protein